MPKVKRIIDGKTYNTETSTLIVDGPLFSPDDPWEGNAYLYQNRYGAFFRVEIWSSLAEPMGDQEELKPMTAEDVRTWLQTRHADRPDIFESLFGEMPEAGSGEVKFTLRMPESLRDRLAAKAKENGQSLNAFIIRRLEAHVRS